MGNVKEENVGIIKTRNVNGNGARERCRLVLFNEKKKKKKKKKNIAPREKRNILDDEAWFSGPLTFNQ